MLEKDAKNKRCPMFTAQVAVVSVMAAAEGMPKDDLRDLLNAAIKCDGSDCVMWEPNYINEDVKADEKPEGEGWYLVNRYPPTYRRYIPTDEGDCGLKSKEQGCNYG